MSVYKITFVPMERFFFGSDNTFGNNNQENYFVRSMHFPQQTTLLGALRYLLLKDFDVMDKDGKITDSEKSNEIIGETGFSVKQGKNNYGIIESLSPLFITGPDGDYFVNSREYGLDWVEDEFSGEKKQQIIPLFYKQQKGSSILHKQKDHIPLLSGITSKTVIPDLLISTNTGKIRSFNYNPLSPLEPTSGIFIEDEQIGINTKQLKDALFKQIGFRLANGYGFSFYAEFKDGEKYKMRDIKNTPIKMGSDQSWFIVSAQLIKGQGNLPEFYIKPLKKLFRFPNSASSKIVLLSDTYIEREVFQEKINFAISEIYPFRFMTTYPESTHLVQSNDIYLNKRGGYKIAKGLQNFELIKKGSVLFVNHNDKEDLINLISGKDPLSSGKGKFNETIYSSFNQIGYNYAI